MNDRRADLSNCFFFPLSLRFRSIPANGVCTIILHPCDRVAEFRLSNWPNGCSGFSLSSPAATDDLKLTRLFISADTVSVTPATPLSMLDVTLYVMLSQPIFRGCVRLPRAVDVLITTPWDQLNVIGNSTWTACCVDPQVHGVFLGRPDAVASQAEPSGTPSSLPPRAAHEITVSKEPSKERTKP